MADEGVGKTTAGKTTGEELLALLDYAHGRLRERLKGIDDEEYLWEPVADCWSLRPIADGDDASAPRPSLTQPSDSSAPSDSSPLSDLSPAPVPASSATFRADYSRPAPDPAPFTTIGWRIWHIGDCLRSFSDRFFEDRAGFSREWPGNAAEGIAAMNAEWARFRGHVAGLDEEGLARELGPAGGPYAKDSYHALVLHVIDEVIHHGAEIGVLRDLYIRLA